MSMNSGCYALYRITYEIFHDYVLFIVNKFTISFPLKSAKRDKEGKKKRFIDCNLGFVGMSLIV